MHILLLDNYDSFTYNLAQLLTESNMCTFEIIKNDKIEFDYINKFDKILLSPGPDIPSKAGKMPEILKLFYKIKPILGVCLGMQAIAEFFGSKIINLKNVYHGIDKEIKILKDDYLFNNLEKKQNVGLYHSWAVSNEYISPDLVVTSVSADGIIMSISHVVYDIKGVQFHPESFITKNGNIMIKNWLEK